MRHPFRYEGETKRDDTRSYAWDSVGLTQQVDQQAIRKARWQALRSGREPVQSAEDERRPG